MPSIITHGIVGACMTDLYSRNKPLPGSVWAAAIAAAIVPDLDVAGFQYGIHYEDFLGHRGFMHSFLFAFLIGVTFAAALRWIIRVNRRFTSLAVFLFLVAASHGILDAFTDGGLGVAFFSPFDLERYFFPWRPLLVSPIGLGAFFSERGRMILMNEIHWVWFPAFAVIGARRLYDLFLTDELE